MAAITKKITIIGAGPAGLAAAAHVIERGMTPIVLEAGPEAVTRFGSGNMFSCFRPGNTTLIRPQGGCLRRQAGIRVPRIYPTGAELLDQYIEPLAKKTALRDVIKTSTRVTRVGRLGFDNAKTKGREGVPFEIRYRMAKAPRP